MSVLQFSAVPFAGAGLVMRYIEQIKYSLNYHWGILCEIWDGFTLHNWHWYIVGAFFVIGIVPIAIDSVAPALARYYFGASMSTPPIPATNWGRQMKYLRIMQAKPSFFWLFAHYWVKNDVLYPVYGVLGWVSAVLLVVVWFRQE